MCSFIEQLVSALSGMKTTEQIDVLGSLINGQDLEAQINGAVFNIVIRGLAVFSTKALLAEIGISEDDPRSQCYETTSGYLIDKRFILELRRISAKKDTIARNAGGIQIGSSGKFVWWIPNEGLAEFAQKIRDLQNEYSNVVEEIYRDYWSIRSISASNIQKAAEKTWEDYNVRKPGSMNVSQADYVSSAVNAFDEKFIRRDQLHEKIRIDVFLQEKDYHPVVMNIAEKMRQNASSQRINGSPQQLNLLGDPDIPDIEEIKSGFQRESRMGTVDAVNAEIEMRLGDLAKTLEDATDSDSAKGPVYRKLRNQLNIVKKHKGTRGSVDRVISHLDRILDSGCVITQRDVNVMNRLVSDSIDEVVKSIQVDALTTEMAVLVQSGDANLALSRLQELKEELEDSLRTAKAMQTMMLEKVSQSF